MPEDVDIVRRPFPDQALHNSLPRGGPIYVPDLVGPITRAAEFETLAFEELESLRAEVLVVSSQVCEDDLSLDELKVFTEEELVERALDETFKNDNHHDGSSPILEDHSKSIRKDCCRTSSNNVAEVSSLREEIHNSASSESVNGPIVESGKEDCSGNIDENSSKKKTKKRGRSFDRDTRAAELEGSYIAKVEQLAKIKQKQDEEKFAANLHSFNGSCKIYETAIQFVENIEKMTSIRSTTSALKARSSSTYGSEVVSHPEVLLCVEIYSNARHYIKTQEFLVLGRQPLTELRDQIYCLTDQLMHKAGQHDPSGYFLIENVFCNDLRDSSAVNYSEPIFEWLRNSKYEALEKWEWILSGELQPKQKVLFGNATTPPLPQFRSVEMHKIRFCDLWFRLGAAYLYCHQGDCKHTIVIRDMRLLHEDDVKSRAAYPVLTFQQKSRLRKCCVCRIYRASKLTVDDKWAQENPCYFCDNCYYLLHYNEDGALLYHDFTVYDHHNE